MAIKHTRQVTSDEEASPTTEINKDEWNEGHTIEAGTITNADVNASAAIAESKIARSQIRKSSTATVTALTTSVTVTHGLGYTPSVVLISPLEDLGGRRYWAPPADYGALTFKIYISSQDINDLSFGWDAIYNVP